MTEDVRRLLADPPQQIAPGRALWGFDGLHGGLTLALLAGRMQQAVPGRELTAVSAQFHESITDPVEFGADVIRVGRRAAGVTAVALAAGVTAATASAVLGTPGVDHSGWAVPRPLAPPPEDCEVFEVPREFVPVAAQTEIRPVGDARPYSGGDEPELAAWVRLVGSDAQPGPLELVFLLDALAPSYAALLTDLVALPTVELSVHLTGVPVRTPSPWILLRARTRSASGVWVSEDLDAWAEDGTLLATGRQLRLVREPRLA